MGRTTLAEQAREEEIGRVAALAEKMITRPTGVRPPNFGSRVQIYKQDPTTRIGIRTAYVHGNMEPGPQDSQIASGRLHSDYFQILPLVHADESGDFLCNPESTLAFDAVHTFAVARQTLTLFQRILGRKLAWQWMSESNQECLEVYPHAGGDTANAFYSRKRKALAFFYFTPPGQSEEVFTCRSLDIVAHETGHAILDALKPGFLSSSHPQTGGLHESFADLASIFLVLSQFDQVEFLIAATKADLHQKNLLASIAEQFGTALGRPNGLRNADNNLKLSDVSNQVHDISRVFTGAIYDILADAFTASRQPRIHDDARVLYDVARNVSGLVTMSILAAPDKDATYKNVAEKMLNLAKEKFPKYAEFVEKHFTFREVIGTNAVKGLAELADFAGCCGTMGRKEWDENS